MKYPIITSPVGSEQDVVLARQRASHIAELLGFDPLSRTRVATSVSEIARNAHRYAGGGSIEFALGDTVRPSLEVVVSDRGRGIADLEAVLQGRYHSTTGMGMGIIGARRLMDDLEIQTGSRGTVVRMIKFLPPRPVFDPPSIVASITSALSRSAPPSAGEELHRQNLELFAALDELGRRHEELLRLDRELEDTNRGVVALYAELDDRAERLRDSNQVKSRFLSYMSHEFRTPLSSILALSRLLLDRTDGELSEEQEKQVRYIYQSARDLIELVNDLLDIARVEAGKVPVASERFTIAAVFGALRGVMRPLLTDTSVALIIEIPDEEIEMWSDESKLAQILRNLVSNALKFTETGTVRVSARLSDDRQRVAISVDDTGIGIAEADLKVIFEEFAQIKSRVQGRVKGTGLGLPLSRRLAAALGGGISVTSEPGRGSTFVLDLPLRYEQPAGRTAAGQAVTDADASTTDAPGVGAICLIVDDEEPARYLLRRLLEDEGCTVIEATRGVDALAIAAESTPDVIMLDQLMPDMLGLEVAERIAHDEKLRDISVVMVTSQTLSEAEHQHLVRLRVPLVPKQSLTRGVVRAVLNNRRAVRTTTMPYARES